MASVVRLISPLPPAEVRERIAGEAKRVLPLEGILFEGLPGVRVRFAAGGEIVLKEWAEFKRQLVVDSCRVELVPLDQEAPAGGTVLVCQFFAPPGKQAASVLVGLFLVVFGLGVAIAGLHDPRVGVGYKILTLLLCGVMIILGVRCLPSNPPRERPDNPSRQYVLSWLERVAAASGTDSPADSPADG